MAPRDLASFDKEVARSLTAIEASPSDALLDAFVDPLGAVAALGGTSSRVLLRAAPVLGKSGGGYGPEPRDPVWIGVDRGSPKLRMAALRAAAPEELSVVAVSITASEIACCDAPSCSNKKQRTTLTLEVAGDGADPRELVVAEGLGEGGIAVRLVARAVAVFVGMDLKGDLAADAESPISSATARTPLTAGSMARFAARFEGARFVLRDFASAGPRGSAGSKLAVAVALAIASGAFWAETARAARTGGTSGYSLGTAAIAVLLAITAYAYFGVSRFAARYGARSAPRVAIGSDRIVVEPWVSRGGAVDERAEGRLGAAIPLGEVNRVSVLRRDGAFAVEVDTDHGPIDALLADREDVATIYGDAIRRAIAEAAHPHAGASAKQRARARAKAAPKPE